jgi:sugar/nucleoside kinase (ribokinase family)
MLKDNRKFDIAGFGHAPIDIIVEVDEEFLNSHGFTKGACNLIDTEKDRQLQNLLENYLIEAGGAVANTLSGVGALGGKCIFNSRLSGDALGKKFHSSLENYGVVFTGITDDRSISDKVYIFTTPDRERTFGTFHGVSDDMSPKDIIPEAYEIAGIMYTEGFMLNIENGYEILLELVEISKNHDTKTAFCPNDSRIVRDHLDEVRHMTELCDIIVMNKTEAMAVSETSCAIEACKIISEISTCGAVTLGAEGACFYRKGEDPFYLKPPELSRKTVNTNGAGDQFAAGFLFGLAKEMDFSKSALLALECGTRALTHYSARPQKDFARALEKVS